MSAKVQELIKAAKAAIADRAIPTYDLAFKLEMIAKLCQGAPDLTKAEKAAAVKALNALAKSLKNRA